ncbi:MAG TPA: 2-hydroxyacid dehydrogenase [Hyphomicrobiaceae bacterium]|jgi:lactate dehydrogenase-like 2-hydroxyacid dehydrogenase|nr:2-hydroxyacid dehydrogenase [Hyphomicrobiaceae bacterium]
MAKPELLMTGPMMPLIRQGAESRFAVHWLHEIPDREAFLQKSGANISAVCTGSHTGVRTDAELMAALPNLKIIGNFGVGYDTIDVAAAAKRGVVITNTPDVLTEEVADTAVGLLLSTIREFNKAEQWLRDGRWAREGDYRLTPASLRDRSIGIVGLGRIGKAIARRCAAFAVPVSYYGRNAQKDVPYRYYSDLVALARDVDTLIVATPGGPETAKLISAAVLEALGPRGILINVARGSVVDEPALITALGNHTIMAAGLDVFMGEPKIDPAFLSLDNAVLLPHVGSASIHTRNAMGQLVVDNLAAFADGKPPKTPVPETPFKGW